MSIDFRGRAEFSPCSNYRYLLERRFVPRARRENTVLFIGLNPSTADATSNDPTIHRCTRFAHDWGFDRLFVGNLFAWRSPWPEALFAADEPVGDANDEWLSRMARRSRVIVACWGRHGRRFERDEAVISLLHRRLMCLAINADGTPAHPLYQPANRELRPYVPGRTRKT
ncbi:MAG: hypothetical protein CSB44_11960 [Gammaproteobacteria bacterium]|nr:MAG: hypothetical protein CSB44_11960 [Gammaproteobacteria bacterium]